MSKPGSRAKKPSAAKASKTESVPSADPAAAVEAGGPLVLPADLRVGTAGRVFAEVVSREASQELVIDGAPVEKLDAAGLQALLAALQHLSRSGTGWRWHNPSTVLVQGIAVLGLEKSLRLP